MSSGIIWYKTQPDSKRSAAVNDLLTDYCGTVRSHDVTVHPNRIASLISDILSRCENVIIIGGTECQRQEQDNSHRRGQARNGSEDDSDDCSEPDEEQTHGGKCIGKRFSDHTCRYHSVVPPFSESDDALGKRHLDDKCEQGAHRDREDH